jgi:NodT family efflux transporter outer membrane factor (OMF) lipoprotein
MKKWQATLAAASLLLLSACASQQGITSHAQVKNLSALSGASQLQTSSAIWPDTHWATQIGGQALQNLIDSALADSPSLLAASARIDAARAMKTVVTAYQKPSLGLNAGSTYQRFTENGLIPPPLAGEFYTDNSVTLGVAYEFDFWNKHSAELRAILSQEKIAEAERQSARLGLSTAIARTWLQLARQTQQLAISEQLLQLREEQDQLIALRVKAGLDTDMEVQQGLLQRANLKNEITSWRDAIALSRNQLAALMGAGPERGQQIAVPALAQQKNFGVPANLALDLLGRRPDIVAARWRLEAGQSEIDLAKVQFYPNVSISAFLGLSSLGLEKFVNTGSTIVGAGPALHMPIFAGNRLRAQLSSKVASYDVAVATYNQSLIEAIHEVADQVQNLQGSAKQAEQQLEAVRAAQTALQLAQKRYTVGTSNNMPVLLAKTTLLMQQKMVSDIAIRHADSQVNLIKALGGGYDANAELAALPSPQASHVLDAAATSSSHSTSKSEGAQ